MKTNSKTQPVTMSLLEHQTAVAAKVRKLLAPWPVTLDGMSRIWVDVPGEGRRRVDSATIEAANKLDACS